jgi:hypothetical protein
VRGKRRQGEKRRDHHNQPIQQQVFAVDNAQAPSHARIAPRTILASAVTAGKYGKKETQLGS